MYIIKTYEDNNLCYWLVDLTFSSKLETQICITT